MFPVVQIYRNISVRHKFDCFLLNLRGNMNKRDTKGCESKALKVQNTAQDRGTCSTALQDTQMC